MASWDAQSQEKKRQKYKKENKEQRMWKYLFEFIFKCGKTNVSVYLYSNVRIIVIPYPICSHTFRLLIFLSPAAVYTMRFTDITWASLLKFLLAGVCCQASSSNKQTPLVSHWTNLAPQCGVKTTNVVLTLLRSRVL